jgi:hypothetical protein
MCPVKRSLPLRTEPLSEPLKHPKVVRYGPWLLPREPVGEVQLHAVDRHGRENSKLLQRLPTEEQKLAAVD